MSDPTEDSRPWYAGVTGYQWLVLAIASAGWVFDTYEGQIFNITRKQMLGELLGTAGNSQAISRWGTCSWPSSWPGARWAGCYSAPWPTGTAAGRSWRSRSCSTPSSRA